MWAAYWGVPDVVKILIAAGASLNIRDNDGRTALMNACKNNNPTCSRVLLEAKADVTIKDNKGKTALQQTTDEDIKTLLRAAGAR
jgi:ankyrin repeat protein